MQYNMDLVFLSFTLLFFFHSPFFPDGKSIQLKKL